VGKSILCLVLDGAIGRLQNLDDQLTLAIHGAATTSAASRLLTRTLARHLATLEVGLMVALATTGRRGAAARMIGAVCLVYGVSELLGMAWRRRRPFARLSEIHELVEHASGRSFPSRHVASGLAMAAIGRAAQPRLGHTMAGVAWLLGASRVAAGLHYPSDVLGGALLGVLVGRVLRTKD
jgi:undecaprenyl-diphosphatase